MRNKEIETKYNADDVSLELFMGFCESLSPLDTKTASGFDRFYEKKSDPDSFCRHRQEPGKFNQLSFKRKLTDKNNYIRTEHNISLGLDVGHDKVGALCAEFDYRYNTSIFKNCFIYKYALYTLVYYVCYDTKLKELGRFIEIEMDEDHSWKDDDEAWQQLIKIESTMSTIGLTPRNRMKRSLFEMFRADK